MKKKLALLAAPVVMLAASTAMASHWGFTPYVGADAELRHMNLERNFGGNIFQHNYPQGNIYVGAKLNEYLAIEGGYEASERKTRTANLQPGDYSAGVLFTPGFTATTNSTGQVKGLHANLIGLYPICDAYRLQLIGMLGFARLKANFTRTTVIGNGAPVNVVTNFKARKSVLRLGAGVQHMINCNWGVRAMLKWEQTNKFKMNGLENANTSIKAKNSLIYSLGAFYTFN